MHKLALASMAVLASCVACRSSDPRSRPVHARAETAQPPKSGPVLALCQGATVGETPQAVERLAWGLWLPICTTETRLALRQALDEATANIDAAAFGAEDMLEGPVEGPVVELLNRVGGGLVGARALASLTIGTATPAGTLVVLPSCPTETQAACQCTQVDPVESWPGATRAQAWPLTEAVQVTILDDDRAAVVRRLKECQRLPATAIGFLPAVSANLDPAESRSLATSAARLARRLERVPPDETVLRAIEMADGIANADPVLPAWVEVGGPGLIWVVPKLSRIAGRPLLAEVQRCLAGARVQIR